MKSIDGGWTVDRKEALNQKVGQIAIAITELEKYLAVAEYDSITGIAIYMTNRFVPQPHITPTEFLLGYQEALKGIPATALADAANHFVRGLVPTHQGRFVPIGAELAQLARSLALPNRQRLTQLQLEHANARTLLEKCIAELAITPEQRAAAAAARAKSARELNLRIETIQKNNKALEAKFHVQADDASRMTIDKFLIRGSPQSGFSKGLLSSPICSKNIAPDNSIFEDDESYARIAKTAAGRAASNT